MAKITIVIEDSDLPDTELKIDFIRSPSYASPTTVAQNAADDIERYIRTRMRK